METIIKTIVDMGVIILEMIAQTNRWGSLEGLLIILLSLPILPCLMIIGVSILRWFMRWFIVKFEVK